MPEITIEQKIETMSLGLKTMEPWETENEWNYRLWKAARLLKEPFDTILCVVCILMQVYYQPLQLLQKVSLRMKFIFWRFFHSFIKKREIYSVSQDITVLFLAIFNHQSISIEIRVLIFWWKLILIQIILWHMINWYFW